MNIPISKPYFDNEDKEIIQKPLESGWVVQGPFVREFEESFAKFIKMSYAIATSSCTTALHLGLVAMGIKRGDKVVVPSFTYVASANAIEYVGAIPVFCDISLETFNIDTDKLKEILQNNSDIKAIMPVHLFGLCANMTEIMKLAKEYDVKVIEDCACGFDSWILNKHCGSFGDCGCFSFHPRKALSTGEGGMVVTHNEILNKHIRSLRDHGASKSDLERHLKSDGFLLPEFNEVGFNYRMTDIQGALGVSQMKKSKLLMDKRREIANKYNESLKDIKEIQTPQAPQGYIHGYQSYVVLFGANMNPTLKEVEDLGKRRIFIMRELEKCGIATRQGTHAVHTLGYYKNKYNIKNEDFLKSYAAQELSISLPLYPQMSNEEFDYVILNLKRILA